MSTDPLRSRVQPLPVSTTSAPAAPAAPAAAAEPAAAAAVPAADAFHHVAAPASEAAAPVDPTALQGLLSEKLTQQPELAGKLDLVSGLNERRNQLKAALDGKKAELNAWREQHGGIDSNLRILAGGKKMVENLLHGEAKFWEGAGKEVTDAETLERAPQRDAIDDLTKRLKQVDDALLTAADGGALPTGEDVDFRLVELAKEAAGEKLTPTQLLDGRLARLEKDAAAKKTGRGFEGYLACADVYLNLKNEKGEGVELRADGGDTVTGALNRLARAGLVELKSPLAITAADVAGAKDAVAALRKDEKKASNPRVSAQLAQLTDEALDGEAKRLETLQKDPAFAAMLPKMEKARAALQALDADGGGFAGFMKGIGHVLDSPETLLMVGAAQLTAGKVGVRALGALGMRSASVGDVAVMLRARQLEWGTIRAAATATAVDAAAFHTVMNGLNIARGKPDRATWSATDYARTILLFEVLGGVNANAFSRDLAKTALGRTARGFQRFGEELGAMTTLAGTEALIRTGNLEGAAHALRDNFQFLIAMRAISGLSATKDPKVRELSRLEKNTAMWTAAAERAPTGENIQKAVEAQRAYEIRFRAITRGYQEAGLTSKPQQKLSSHLDSVSGYVFSARVEAARSHELSKATTAEEKTAINARYDGLAKGPAFFDPATGRLVLDEAKATEAGMDAVVRHEGSHLAFQLLPAAERSALVSALTSSPAWAGIHKSFTAGEGRSGLSTERVVDELLADWNASGGKPDGAVAKKFAALVAPGTAAGRVIAGAGADLRGLDAKGVEGAVVGKPYNPAVESTDLAPFTVPDRPADYPAELRFRGDGLFAEKLAELNRTSRNARFSYQDLYRALFGDGSPRNPVALARKLMLSDGTTQVNTLAQLDKYNGDALFIPNRSPEFYLQRLATMPFVASTREARDVSLEGIALRNAESTARIAQTLRADRDRAPSDAQGVWDAVIVGAGPHGAAAAMEFRKANPNARLLVIDEAEVGSQFSRTGEAFIVNSSAYGDRGQPAVPTSGEGDLNPTLGPVVVSDLQAGKYSLGRDIGDAAVINLETAGADTLFSARVRRDAVEDGFATGVAQRENWPARYRVAVRLINKDGTTDTVRLFTNQGAAATGIPDLGLGRFERRSQDFLLRGVMDTERNPAGSRRIQTGQQFLEAVGSLGLPREFAREKKTLIVGSGDSAYVVAEQLYGLPAAPDIRNTTFENRQLGVPGKTLLATTRRGPMTREDFANLERLRSRYADIPGQIRGRENDIELTNSDVVAVRELSPGGKLEVFLANDAADTALRNTGARLSRGTTFDYDGKSYEVVETPKGPVAAEKVQVDNVILTSGQSSVPERFLGTILPGKKIESPVTQAVLESLRRSPVVEERVQARRLAASPFVALDRSPDGQLTGYVRFRDADRLVQQYGSPDGLTLGPTQLGRREVYVARIGNRNEYLRPIAIPSEIALSERVRTALDVANQPFGFSALPDRAAQGQAVFDPSQPLSEQAIAPPVSGPPLNPQQPFNTNYGRKIAESEWYLIGPTVGPNLVPPEALANVRENSASLFNLIDGSGAIGRQMAAQANNLPIARRYTPQEAPPEQLSINSRTSANNQREVPVSPMSALEELEFRPLQGNEQALLKVRLGAALAQFNYDRPGNITLTVYREAASDGSGRIVFKSPELSSASLETLTRTLGQDDRFISLVKQATSVDGQTLEFVAPIGDVNGQNTLIAEGLQSKSYNDYTRLFR